MMRNKVVLLMCLCALGLFEHADAEEQDKAEEKHFSNETSISLVNTTGNTDSLSLAGKNEMTYKFSDKWAASWIVGAIYNQADDETETERYYATLRGDYSITDRWYAYGLGSWLRDTYAGFDHRIGIGPGLGYRFLVGPTFFMHAEGGLNYSYEDYTDSDVDSEEFAEGRLFAQFGWQFAEKTKFSQGVEYLQNIEDGNAWKLNSETALITSLTDILALKISYSVFYNHDPQPSDLSNTDAIFATSVVVTF